MASTFIKGKKIYFSYYDVRTGTRKNKSTGLDNTPENLRKAKSACKIFQQKLDRDKKELKELKINRHSIQSVYRHFRMINSNKADKTKAGYEWFYKKFTESFDPNSPMTILDKNKIENWLIKVNKFNIAQNTKYDYFKILNKFLKFAVEYSYLPHFIINKAVRPKPEICKKIVFNKTDQKTIFSAADVCKNPELRTLIYLLSYTGLRPSDLMTIEINDIDLEKQMLKYYSPKTHQHREVAFHTDLIPILNTAIKSAEGLKLFNYKSHFRAGRAVVDFLRRLNLSHPKFVSKTFRKTFITRANESGINMTVRNELTGHAHGNTADKYYAYISPDMMKTELTKLQLV